MIFEFLDEGMNDFHFILFVFWDCGSVYTIYWWDIGVAVVYGAQVLILS